MLKWNLKLLSFACPLESTIKRLVIQFLWKLFSVIEKKIEPEDEFRLYQKQTEVVQGKGDINVCHITLKISFDKDFTVDKMAFSACQWLMVSELLLLWCNNCKY